MRRNLALHALSRAPWLTACLLAALVGCGGGEIVEGAGAGAAGSGETGGTARRDPAAATSRTLGSGDPADSAATARHVRCGWLAAADEAGEQSFIAHASWFDVLHPFWWKLGGDGMTLVPLPRMDQPEVLAAARAAHVRIFPLVYVDDTNALRATLADPARRAAHVAQLVQIAAAHGYDGMEIDYEKLWQASDRPGLTALLSELATAMHAQGKQVSMAVPSLDQEVASNGYDYGALAQSVDRIHLMGYDFHSIGSDHAGPIAPLGWLRGVMTHVQQVAQPSKFSLGVANYGIAPGRAYTAAQAQQLCGGAGAYSQATNHMATCPYGDYEAGLAPHCSIGGADTYFEDLGSWQQKLALAKSFGLGGMAYYSLGGEAPGFFEMAQAAFSGM